MNSDDSCPNKNQCCRGGHAPYEVPELLDAVREQDFARFYKLLASGADANAPTNVESCWRGKTVLHAALDLVSIMRPVLWRQTAVLALIDHGGNLACRGLYVESPLEAIESVHKPASFDEDVTRTAVQAHRMATRG